MAKRSIPEINAASMADIAFLLLCFFLVTTTFESDKGVARVLPPPPDGTEQPPNDIRQRNLMQIEVNFKDDILVNSKYTKVEDLKDLVKDFVDNGAGNNLAGEDKVDPCDYCNGNKLTDSSEHPSQAVIAIKNQEQTSYKMFIAVQSQIDMAFHDLYDQVAKKKYGRLFDDLPENGKEQKEIRKTLYPKRIAELKLGGN